MKQKYLSEAKQMARNAGYHDVKRIGKWKGYEVFEQIFTDDEIHFIGIPQYILYKDGALRWTKDKDESFAIMDAFL
jgi:hypothetical protein